MKKLAKILSLTMVLLVSMLVFTACVPSDIESAREKMKEAGYFVSDSPNYYEDESIIGGITATKLGDGLIALYFTSSNKAKEYAENWYDSKYDCGGYSGKWAFIGTEDAIKDFKA